MLIPPGARLSIVASEDTAGGTEVFVCAVVVVAFSKSRAAVVASISFATASVAAPTEEGGEDEVCSECMTRSELVSMVVASGEPPVPSWGGSTPRAGGGMGVVGGKERRKRFEILVERRISQDVGETRARGSWTTQEMSCEVCVGECSHVKRDGSSDMDVGRRLLRGMQIYNTKQ